MTKHVIIYQYINRNSRRVQYTQMVILGYVYVQYSDDGPIFEIFLIQSSHI